MKKPMNPLEKESIDQRRIMSALNESYQSGDRRQKRR